MRGFANKQYLFVRAHEFSTENFCAAYLKSTEEGVAPNYLVLQSNLLQVSL